METNREEFLIEMYGQMMHDIDRHIMVIWQSVGVLVGSLAVIALAEKGIVSLDVSTAIIILLCAWLFAHLVDSAYWYNRNLAIIANIERQFLHQTDLRDIHYYFGEHRPKNRMIAHLRTQMIFGIALGALVLANHFFSRVVPGLGAPWSNFEPVRALPYVAAVLAVVWPLLANRATNVKYAEFLANSPGKTVDSTGIEYGPGHGFPKPHLKRIA
jgi:hypothetical protein